MAGQVSWFVPAVKRQKGKIKNAGRLCAWHLCEWVSEQLRSTHHFALEKKKYTLLKHKWPQPKSGFNVKFHTFWSKAGLCVVLFFLWKWNRRNVRSVWPFLHSVPFPLHLLPKHILTCVCASLCEVFRAIRAIDWTLTTAVTQYVRNSDRQLDWRCVAGLFDSLFWHCFFRLCPFPFLCIVLSGVRMPASLPHDPDVVSCPESVNSASLLVGTEQLQKSTAKQLC